MAALAPKAVISFTVSDAVVAVATAIVTNISIAIFSNNSKSFFYSRKLLLQIVCKTDPNC
jgi:hypothetical protein